MYLPLKIEKTMNDHAMQGTHIIAALSGGADSVCLLLCLMELSVKNGFSLSAVHVNHLLRGEESDRDEDFCRRLCERLGVALSVFHVDVRAQMRSYGCSVEETARRLRYDCFYKELEKFPRSFIATAHNICDNSETILFNLARGTGLKGICGIPYVRGQIIRPLLDCSRSEIEDYLNEKGQDFVTDSTNLSDDCSRNRIRHCVIPELMKINSGFFTAASRLSKITAETEDFFLKSLENVSNENLPDLHPALRKRYIGTILSENNVECSYERLCELDELVAQRKNARVDLSGDLFAVVKAGLLTVEKADNVKKNEICIKIDPYKEGEIFLPEFDKIVKIKRIINENSDMTSNVLKNLTYSFVNYGKIQGGVFLRCKRDGDTVMFKGRGFHTKLKKLYNELKLSPEERLSALVMEDSEGIFWSEYGGSADRVSDGDCGSFMGITVIRR